MMEHTATITIGLDTPIQYLTPRQLFQMQAEWMGTNSEPLPKNDTRGWYVNSVKELAAILGTSPSTVYRMKKDGLLDDAISQYGKWTMIDVNKVIETFRLSRRNARG